MMTDAKDKESCPEYEINSKPEQGKQRYISSPIYLCTLSASVACLVFPLTNVAYYVILLIQFYLMTGLTTQT